MNSSFEQPLDRKGLYGVSMSLYPVAYGSGTAAISLHGKGADLAALARAVKVRIGDKRVDIRSGIDSASGVAMHGAEVDLKKGVFAPTQIGVELHGREIATYNYEPATGALSKTKNAPVSRRMVAKMVRDVVAQKHVQVARSPIEDDALADARRAVAESTPGSVRGRIPLLLYSEGGARRDAAVTSSGEYRTAFARGKASFERARDVLAIEKVQRLDAVLASGIIEKKGDRLVVNEAGMALRRSMSEVPREAIAEAATFDERNARNANVIATEASHLLAHAEGSAAELDKVYVVMKHASFEAGRAYSAAFTREGGKAARELAVHYYSAAHSDGTPGRLALQHLAWSLTERGMGDDSSAMWRQMANRVAPAIEGAGLSSAADAVASALGTRAPVDMATLAARVKDVVPDDDYYAAQAKSLPLGDTQHASGRQVVARGLRLANVTWKAGQLLRAVWEGKTDRISPDKRPAYDSFDGMVHSMYTSTYDAEIGKGSTHELAHTRGFARASFEVYKDLLQLKGAAAAYRKAIANPER